MYILGGLTDCPEVLYYVVFPLGFFLRKMGVLQADWHGPIRPWSFRFYVTGAIPNKASQQREGLIFYWIMFVLS